MNARTGFGMAVCAALLSVILSFAPPMLALCGLAGLFMLGYVLYWSPRA